MSTSTVALDRRSAETGLLDAPVSPVSRVSVPAARVGRTAAPGRVRPGRRTGRGARPQARPDQGLSTPRSLAAGVSGVRSCAPVAAGQVRPRPQSSSWRLTDRGIAVVLVGLAMIVTAALVVVGLTALRVTGTGYEAAAGVHAAAR